MNARIALLAALCAFAAGAGAAFAKPPKASDMPTVEDLYQDAKKAIAPRFASFGISCSKKRAGVSLSGNCASGKPTRKVSVLEGSMPMSVFCSFRKLRIISPAPINKTKARATSAM